MTLSSKMQDFIFVQLYNVLHVVSSSFVVCICVGVTCVPAGSHEGKSYLHTPVPAGLSGVQWFDIFRIEHLTSTWTLSAESPVQQIFCRSAARAARGLSVGPIYEIGLSVTTVSD